MRRNFTKIWLSLLIVLFSISASHALELPAIPDAYVNDYAGVLSAETKQALTQLLSATEAKTTNQILVATVSDLQGDSIEEFGIRLAEKWKPGQKGRDNGVILLVAPRERKVRIEVGYGLEAVLTDARTRLIIENEIIPSFRQGDYDTGVRRGAEAIVQASLGEYRPQARAAERRGSLWVDLLLLLFFGTIVLVMIAAKSATFGRRGPWMGGGGWGGGFGGSSGSSGGFSSGGGSFGGGGSSGSW